MDAIKNVKIVEVISVSGGIRMERLTKRELIELKDGQKIVACNSKDDECNDYCMHGYCKWNDEALKKLKEYEDAEEQGLLIRLPFRIGETVFTVDGRTQGGYDVFDWDVFGINEDGLVLTSPYSTIHVLPDCIENNVFLTREEAEAALERMNNES